jgi:ribosomal protein L16 Arg81 hydroxylase
MTCRFLENLTLRSLIAPVAEEEFRARYWTQKPLVVHRKDPDYYGDLFTLQDFDEAIAGADHVQTSNTANRKNETYKGATVPGSEAVLADMREGGTLVLIQYHRQEPKLRQLCRLLGAEFGHKFHANMYLTPPHGKGFTPHFDFSEMFILQVFGSKRWKIEKQRRSFRTKERKGMTTTLSSRRPTLSP